MTADQARWHRLRRGGLAGPGFDSPTAAARTHLGIQAQINSAARLALCHRLAGPSTGDRLRAIDAALGEHAVLVRCWGQRGTLHLYAPDDWPLVCAAAGEREIERSERRLRKREGKNAAAALASHRRLSRAALELLRRAPEHRVGKESLERAGFPADAFWHYGAFIRLTLEGHGCRVDEGDNAAPVLAWRRERFPGLGWKPPPFEKAMREAARRFFTAYGPAREADFRYWLGAAAVESRPAVQALRERGELIEVEVGAGGARATELIAARDLEALTGKPPPPSRWPVLLLGRFDPLILAHADKGGWVDAEHYKRVWHHTHVEAVLLVHGRIRAAWRYSRSARGLTVRVQLFPGPRLTAAARRALDGQAKTVAACFGLPLAGLEVAPGS